MSSLELLVTGAILTVISFAFNHVFGESKDYSNAKAMTLGIWMTIGVLYYRYTMIYKTGWFF